MILLGNEVFDKENLKARVFVYKILVFEMWKVEQELLFGWPVSVTKFSVFITHNSKMVGPKLNIRLAHDNSVSITQFSDF